MDWTEQLMLRVSDCDANGRWKLSGALRLMQEMGETNAGLLGCGRSQLIEQGMCWVLYRLKLRFLRRPEMGDALRVSTWPGGVSGLFFLRYFRFESLDGALVGEAVTTWVLFELENRRLLRPNALKAPVPAFTGRTCSLELPGALTAQALDGLGERVVRYTDLDMNGHMNNARYADWAEDALWELNLEQPVRELQINYVSEARLHDRIAIRARVDGAARALIEGRRAGEPRPVFEVEAGF